MNSIDRVIAELEVLSRQDVEGVLSFYSEDVVFIDVSMAEPLLGKGAMRAFMRGMYEAFSDLRAENVNAFGDDVFVAAEYDLVGTNDGPLDGQSATGKSFRLPAVSVYESRGGTFVRETFYWDSATLARQLGA